MICLLLIERHGQQNKKLIFPINDRDLMNYLKRMHFEDFLKELDYNEEYKILKKVKISELEDINIHEILHCRYKDEFGGRLGHITKMFSNFGSIYDIL